MTADTVAAIDWRKFIFLTPLADGFRPEVQLLFSAAQVKAEFLQKGISIRAWARANQFSEGLVYEILNKGRVPRRGKSHEIAVRLRLKRGEVVSNPSTAL